MNLQIDSELLDQIERYLEQRAAQQDSEATRLLQALEAAEIERTAQVYGLDTDWRRPPRSGETFGANEPN